MTSQYLLAYRNLLRKSMAITWQIFSCLIVVTVYVLFCTLFYVSETDSITTKDDDLKTVAKAVDGEMHATERNAYQPLTKYFDEAINKKVAIVGYANPEQCDDDPLCQVNMKRPPRIKNVTKTHQISEQELVTIVCKTMNRLDLVKRMIESVWDYYPGTKVIVVDDFYKDYLTDLSWQEFLNNHSVVDYVQLGENAGISHGREISVRLVRTKYFMQIDDDFVFTDKTNLTELITVLETTDLSIVTGDYKQMMFTGILKVHIDRTHQKQKQTRLYHFPETAHGLIPGFKHCYSVDLGPNIYLANTEHVRSIHPWDRELKAQEHTDFFLHVLTAGLKVGACTDVQLQEHGVKNSDRKSLKYPKAGVYIMYTLRKWKIIEWFKQCEQKYYYSKIMKNHMCKWNSTYQFFEGDPNLTLNILVDRKE